MLFLQDLKFTRVFWELKCPDVCTGKRAIQNLWLKSVSLSLLLPVCPAGRYWEGFCKGINVRLVLFVSSRSRTYAKKLLTHKLVFCINVQYWLFPIMLVPGVLVNWHIAIGGHWSAMHVFVLVPLAAFLLLCWSSLSHKRSGREFFFKELQIVFLLLGGVEKSGYGGCIPLSICLCTFTQVWQEVGVHSLQWEHHKTCTIFFQHGNGQLEH